MAQMRRAAANATAAAMQANKPLTQQNAAASAGRPESEGHNGTDGTAEVAAEAARPATSADDPAQQAQVLRSNGMTPDPMKANGLRQNYELIDEVGQILKTAFPLLIMSLETIVDQINQRFRGNADEEIYRLICMLLQDALTVRCC